MGKRDEMVEDVPGSSYVQKKLWRFDSQTLLVEIDEANRAGFGFVVDKQLLETGKVWTEKGVQNYTKYGLTTPPYIGEEADTSKHSRFNEDHLREMTKQGHLEHKGRLVVLNLIDTKQVRYIVADNKHHKMEFPAGCVLFPRLGEEAERQYVDDDIKMDFHSFSFDLHPGDVKPKVVAPSPKKRQRKKATRKRQVQNEHMPAPHALTSDTVD